MKILNDTCPVCESPAEVAGTDLLNSVFGIQCTRCGPFLTEGSVVELGWGSVDADARLRASSWIRENRPRKPLSEERLRGLTTMRQLDFVERANRLLLEMRRRANRSMEVDKVTGADWAGVAWESEEALPVLLHYLEELGYVQARSAGWNYVLLPDGLIHIDELAKDGGVGAQGFVAMWFGEEVTALWEQALEPAIRDAGYTPCRIDRREFEGKVDDQIVAEIRRSRFVIADCTGNRGGVYYEAGLAQGLDLPVFWTCRADVMGKVHFDTNHFRFTTWEAELLDEARVAIQRRIEAHIGVGPLKGA